MEDLSIDFLVVFENLRPKFYYSDVDDMLVDVTVLLHFEEGSRLSDHDIARLLAGGPTSSGMADLNIFALHMPFRFKSIRSGAADCRWFTLRHCRVRIRQRNLRVALHAPSHRQEKTEFPQHSASRAVGHRLEYLKRGVDVWLSRRPCFFFRF